MGLIHTDQHGAQSPLTLALRTAAGAGDLSLLLDFPLATPSQSLLKPFPLLGLSHRELGAQTCHFSFTLTQPLASMGITWAALNKC